MLLLLGLNGRLTTSSSKLIQKPVPETYSSWNHSVQPENLVFSLVALLPFALI